MASQGGMQGSGLGAFGGPLAMRQASSAFLEFAALAVGHQQHHACCPPVSPQEKVCWTNAHSIVSQGTLQTLRVWHRCMVCLLRPVSYVLCVPLCMFLMVHVEVLAVKEEHGLTCARHQPLVCVCRAWHV